ncbi:MAG: hypothetical protein ACI3XY_05335 [Butyricicoccaceae bacterium]
MRMMIVLTALLMLAGSVYQWKRCRENGNADRSDVALIVCGAVVVVLSLASLLTGGETGLPFWATVIAAILVGACGGRMYFLAARKHESIRRPLIAVTALLVVMTLSVCVSTFLMK